MCIVGDMVMYVSSFVRLVQLSDQAVCPKRFKRGVHKKN